MPVKREKLIFFVLLPIVVAVCVLLWYMGTLYFTSHVNYVQINSGSGTYDLSGIDFEDTVVRISGDAQYIRGALLTPDEFEQRAREGQAQTGSMEGYGSVSTTRVRLIFPDTGTYMLAYSSSDYAEILYINGEQRGQAGQPGLDKDSEKNGHVFYNLSVKPESPGDDAPVGIVDVVRQVSNFAHRNGGGHAGIYAGSEENIRLYVSLKTDFDGIAVGLFFALFLVHLTLYFIIGSYRANLYLAVMCLAWALRSGVVDTKLLLSTLPFLSWEFAFRLEYLTIPAAVILFLCIIKEIFPDMWRKWPARIAIGISAATGLLFLFADTLVMSHVLFWYNVFYIAVVFLITLYIAIKLPELRGQGFLQSEHWISLLALAVFFYAAVHDALYYNDIHLFGLNRPVTDVAMLIFSFTQMIAMSYGTMREAGAAREKEMRLLRENAGLTKLVRLKGQTAPPRMITKGPLTLDTVALQAYLHGYDISLTPKEFGILNLLVQNEGKALSKEYLYEMIWNQPVNDDARAVWTHISALKRKLSESEGMISIVNERGQGYKFECVGFTDH